jgi:Rrf2 family protein
MQTHAVLAGGLESSVSKPYDEGGGEIALHQYAFMSLLNRKVDYALLILSYLRHQPEGGCARAIAARFGLSRAFVANILKRLCHEGFVASHRGVKGGYALQPGVGQHSLADLMEALDDTFHLAECNTETPGECCSLFAICPVKGPVAEVHRRICELLGKVKLDELFVPAAETADLQAVGLGRLNG